MSPVLAHNGHSAMSDLSPFPGAKQESSFPVVIPDPEGKPLAGKVYAVAD